MKSLSASVKKTTPAKEVVRDIEISKIYVRETYGQTDVRRITYDDSRNRRIPLTMYIIDNPFGNCQSCSLIQAQRVLGFTDLQMDKLINYISNEVDVPQIVIDVYQHKKNDILQKFSKYTRSFIEQDYTNYNGSQMCLIIIQLKEELLDWYDSEDNDDYFDENDGEGNDDN